MSMHGIKADAMTLMRQAGMTAETYMNGAAKAIDGTFGKGYAKNNPQLVAAFMQVAATDYATASYIKAFSTDLENIGAAIDRLAAAVERNDS